MKLSVLIPMYGVEDFIEKCATSLFNQSMTDDIEFIFVDDCSKDKSIERLNRLLNSYTNRRHQVRIISHQYNMGLAASRLTALSYAYGEYIIVCDSDDWTEPEMYEEMLSVAMTQNADIVVSDYYVNTSATECRINLPNFTTKEEFLTSVIKGTTHNGLWNKMIRRRLFENLIPSFIAGVNMWEDVSVLPRLVNEASRIVKIDKAFYHYSQINTNAYTQKWRPEYSHSIDKVLEINIEYFKDKNIDIAPLVQRGLLSILSHETNETSRRYWNQYNELGFLKSVDYSIYGLFNHLLAYCMFNKRFRLGRTLMTMKKWLKLNF